LGGEFSVKGELLTAFLQTLNNFLTTFLILGLKLYLERNDPGSLK